MNEARRATLLAVVSALAVALAGIAAADDLPICARCHPLQTGIVATTGGMDNLTCEMCHEDRRPGTFGPGHRSFPNCATCHQVTGHPPRAAARLHRNPTRNCIRCHEPHGSTNLALVRTGIRVGRRLKPVELTNTEGAAPGGFTNPDHPGSGVCEICHRTTVFYRADGKGAPHPTVSCLICHDHKAGFRPVITDQSCPICHTAEAALFAKPSLHSATFVCSGCHAQVNPIPGPGHRTIPACANCHTNVTHAPPGETPFLCTQCHNPHGTDNADLILDAIATPSGARPIVFNNLLGRADGSFASASAPGTGICEVCHTTTRFYRADGTGETHFTFSCLPCHRHAAGFNPPS